jgi:hypothetical protein
MGISTISEGKLPAGGGIDNISEDRDLAKHPKQVEREVGFNQ